MDKIYLFCVIIAILPFLFSFLGVFIDALDFEFGDFDLLILPLSFSAISIGVFTFGLTGLLFRKAVLAVVLGYIAAIGMQALMRTLRKKQSLAKEYGEYIGCQVTVISRVAPNGTGRVSVTGDGNSVVEFLATTHDSDTVPSGATAVITTFEKENLAVISMENTN